MKERISDFFKKKEESYYEFDEKNLSKSNKTKKDLEKENEALRRELKKSKGPLANQVIDLFKSRRSIRRFAEKNIDEKTIYDILDAAAYAPCAGGIQNYKIIIVRDEKKRCQIGKIAYQQCWMQEAPVCLVITRDETAHSQMYIQEGQCYANQTTAAFIENILMLIHAHGLGACWVEACENQTLKEYLNIPPHLHIDAIIPVGYPNESPKTKRNPISTITFFESFGNKKK